MQTQLDKTIGHRETLMTDRQGMLFGAAEAYRPFPLTQYLGSKQRLVRWIYELSPPNTDTVMDAFSGTSVVGHYFKNRGKRVISNDFLRFNYHIGKALIENPGAKLSDDDVRNLLRPNSNAATLIEDVFTDVFFERDQARFIDQFRANVEMGEEPYKRSLALAIMCRALTRKVTLGHFAHLSALKYSRDPARIKRNRSLTRPIWDIFLDLVQDYNDAVFDNGRDNKVFCEDARDLVTKPLGVDLVYFDPPYCGRHPDYQAFYHFLETFVEYWSDKEFRNGTKSYFPKKPSGFVGKGEMIDSLRMLFERSSHIPYWMISYNSKSYPDKETMLTLLREYRSVESHEWHYRDDYGGKGSTQGTVEYLFLCTR